MYLGNRLEMMLWGRVSRSGLGSTSQPPHHAWPHLHRLVRGALQQAGQLPPLCAIGGQLQGVLLIGVLHSAALGQIPAGGRWVAEHEPLWGLHLGPAHSTHLWKFQVKRSVMSAVPLYSSRFICARLGGLMRHSAPELPSICAVTMSSGLYWLINCMASCGGAGHAQRGAGPRPASPHWGPQGPRTG